MVKATQRSTGHLFARVRVHCVSAHLSYIPCIPTSAVTSLSSIALRRFYGQLLFCCVASGKVHAWSICKMSQLHQEALRRQHVVDKRNVNDLSWLVSMTEPIHSLALFCKRQKRASVDSNCTIPHLLVKNQLKLRKSLSV